MHPEMRLNLKKNLTAASLAYQRTMLYEGSRGRNMVKTLYSKCTVDTGKHSKV